MNNYRIPLDNTPTILALSNFATSGVIGQSCVFDEVDTIICVGGMFSNSLDTLKSTFSKTVWRYSVSTNTGKSDTIDSSFALHTTFFMNGVVYIYGRSTSTTNDLWVMDPVSLLITPVTIASSVKPASRYGHCGVQLDTMTFMISFGVSSDGTLLSDSWVFDISIRVWKRINWSKTLTPRAWSSCSIANNQMFVYGGSTSQSPSTPINEFYTFNFQTLSVQQSTNVPIVPKMGHVAFSVDGYTIVQGGYSTLNKTASPEFYTYDYTNQIWVSFPTTLSSTLSAFALFSTETFSSTGLIIGIVITLIISCGFIIGYIAYIKQRNLKRLKETKELKRVARKSKALEKETQPYKLELTGISSRSDSIDIIESPDHSALVSGMKLICIKRFSASRPNELKIELNDEIVFKNLVNDKYYFGTHSKSKLSGTFPVANVRVAKVRETRSIVPLRISGDSYQHNRISSSVSIAASNSSFKMDEINKPISSPTSAGSKLKPSSSIKKNKYFVTSSYDKSLSDEMNLLLGDEIILKKQFDDTWAEGLNLNTNEKGLFPLSAITKVKHSQVDPNALSVDWMIAAARNALESDGLKDEHITEKKERQKSIQSCATLRNSMLFNESPEGFYVRVIDELKKKLGSRESKAINRRSHFSIGAKKLSHQPNRESAMSNNLGKIFTATEAFVPTLSDEVGLQIGNRIIIK